MAALGRSSRQDNEAHLHRSGERGAYAAIQVHQHEPGGVQHIHTDAGAVLDEHLLVHVLRRAINEGLPWIVPDKPIDASIFRALAQLAARARDHRQAPGAPTNTSRASQAWTTTLTPMPASGKARS
jgi:hypothetical protein